MREVTLGEHGALAGCAPGGVLVDMTTSQPSLAEEIARAAAERGVTAIDAPVSGGDVGARNGTLSIMIGGDRETVERLEPCWQAMGSKWIWQGPAGAGQHTKMVNQTLIAGNMVGVCEALLYAQRAGLNLDTRAGVGRQRRRGKLVAVEPRPADDPRRLRPGVLRRALPQGHGHHPRGSRGG